MNQRAFFEPCGNEYFFLHLLGGLLQLYDPSKKQPFTDRVTIFVTEILGALHDALLIRQNIRGSQHVNALSREVFSARMRGKCAYLRDSSSR